MNNDGNACSADLQYKPLEDLLNHVVEAQPDVVILCGPFLDSKHRLLDPACAGTPGGFSNGDPPDLSVRIIIIIIMRMPA
jgi:hypothetical protein